MKKGHRGAVARPLQRTLWGRRAGPGRWFTQGFVRHLWQLCVRVTRKWRLWREGTSQWTGWPVTAAVEERCAQHRPASHCEALQRAQGTPAGHMQAACIHKGGGAVRIPSRQYAKYRRSLKVAWGHLRLQGRP